MSTALHYDRPDFQKVRRDAPCEACGKADWCLASETTSWCMRNPDGAYATKTDAAGATVYLHRRTGAPAPLPFRAPRAPRADAPDPATCAALYASLAALCASTPSPLAALDDERRRYGDHADGVRAVSDHFYLTPEHAAAFLSRLRAEGQLPAARAAGLVTGAPGAERLALAGRKVYPWRDGTGVRDLRGRAYRPTTGPKVLNLAGSRDERGCPHTFYRGDQLSTATDRRVVLAGGHEKADALAYAGELAIAANEGQLSPTQLDTLAAARPALVVVFADGEDAPADQPQSAGQRLALAAAARLEGRGMVAAVAEPPHAPGEKVDADSFLRDHGPEALRELVRGAVPLAAYRRQIGADIQPQDAGNVTDLAAHVARLQDAVRAARDERDQAQEWNRLTFAALRAGGGGTPLMKKVGRAGLGLVVEWDARRHQGHDQIDPETGERWVEVDLGAAGENVGLADDATGATLTFLCAEGLARKRVKWSTIEHPAPGQFPRRKQLLVHFPQGTREAALAAIAALRPEATATVQPHGGRRVRCDKHPEAGTKTTTTSVTTCGECGDVLDSPPPRVAWHDATGQRTDPPAPPTEVQPQDAGYKLTYSERDTTTTEDPANLQPQLAVEPPPTATAPPSVASWDGTHPCRDCGATCYAPAGAVPRCLPCTRGRPADPWGDVAAGDD